MSGSCSIAGGAGGGGAGGGGAGAGGARAGVEEGGTGAGGEESIHGGIRIKAKGEGEARGIEFNLFFP